jgi:hypothetical protein
VQVGLTCAAVSRSVIFLLNAHTVWLGAGPARPAWRRLEREQAGERLALRPLVSEHICGHPTLPTPEASNIRPPACYVAPQVRAGVGAAPGPGAGGEPCDGRVPRRAGAKHHIPGQRKANHIPLLTTENHSSLPIGCLQKRQDCDPIYLGGPSGRFASCVTTIQTGRGGLGHISRVERFLGNTSIDVVPLTGDEMRGWVALEARGGVLPDTWSGTRDLQAPSGRRGMPLRAASFGPTCTRALRSCLSPTRASTTAGTGAVWRASKGSAATQLNG